MANVLKKAVMGLVEKAFAQVGFVLDVRKWDAHTMVEVDLYLPDVDMSKWQTIQRLKCKVSAYDFEFRDYTPARWDIEKRTCTMYIETGHKGCGGNWANALQAGHTMLFGPAHAAALPTRPGNMLCIGDGSSLGHFLALKQLTNHEEYPMEAIILLGEEYTVPDALAEEHPEFEWLKPLNAENFGLLYQHLQQKSLQDYAYIFIAGNIPMVTELRKMLKRNPYITAKIVVHGFWK